MARRAQGYGQATHLAAARGGGQASPEADHRGVKLDKPNVLQVQSVYAQKLADGLLPRTVQIIHATTLSPDAVGLDRGGGHLGGRLYDSLEPTWRCPNLEEVACTNLVYILPIEVVGTTGCERTV